MKNLWFFSSHLFLFLCGERGGNREKYPQQRERKLSSPCPHTSCVVLFLFYVLFHVQRKHTHSKIKKTTLIFFVILFDLISFFYLPLVWGRPSVSSSTNAYTRSPPISSLFFFKQEDDVVFRMAGIVFSLTPYRCTPCLCKRRVLNKGACFLRQSGVFLFCFFTHKKEPSHIFPPG